MVKVAGRDRLAGLLLVSHKKARFYDTLTGFRPAEPGPSASRIYSRGADVNKDV